jgi:hypothetical protein
MLRKRLRRLRGMAASAIHANITAGALRCACKKYSIIAG